MQCPPFSSILYRASLPLVGACCLIALGACGDEERPENGTPPDELPPQTVLTDGDSFEVSWEGPEQPLPFQELFEIELYITDTASDEERDDLDVELRARLADSTVESPTVPRVSGGNSGQYSVEGLLLHVPQAWELLVNVDDGDQRETARFELQPVGRYEGELPPDPTGTFSDDDLRHILMMSPAPKPPPDPTNEVADDDDAAHLGQFLFFDERFSADGTIACASCHSPDHGFSDPQPLSTGIGTTGRRSMPALNAAYNRWTFWDGRTDSLWAQALQPIESPVEHAITRTRLAHLVYEDEELRQAYESVFSSLPDLSDDARFPLDARPVPDDPAHEHHQAWEAMSDADRQAIDRVFANFGKALAAYQRRLIRNDSDFDRFVAALRDGDDADLDILSDEAREGLRLFVDDANCVDCHGGHQMTNFEFHNLGLSPRNWMPDDPDRGRSAGLEGVIESDFTARGPFSDAPDSDAALLLDFLPEPAFATDGAFKTPGLRNVAERAPYMHGGHLATLEETIDFYSDLQEDPPVGLRDPLVQQLNLTRDEVSALVAFMEALSGDPLPSELTQAPDTPSR